MSLGVLVIKVWLEVREGWKVVTVVVGFGKGDSDVDNGIRVVFKMVFRGGGADEVGIGCSVVFEVDDDLLPKMSGPPSQKSHSTGNRPTSRGAIFKKSDRVASVMATDRMDIVYIC
ncbi:hypothetical protein BSLG_003004 [Batrachochytrium salamandrivorans]|nr:hypothetical protein BSLG_003004 [Batrachochytrium salamandrivorans]